MHGGGGKGVAWCDLAGRTGPGVGWSRTGAGRLCGPLSDSAPSPSRAVKGFFCPADGGAHPVGVPLWLALLAPARHGWTPTDGF